MRGCNWIGFAVGAGLLAATAGRANSAGFALSAQGGAANGTGGAGTARTSDASLAWYNPAALADGQGLRIAVGAMAAAPTVTAAANDGSFSSKTESKISTPPHLYASYAWRDYGAGVAVNVPFGSGVTWPSDWAGASEIISSSITVFRVAPFASIRRGQFSISAGPHIDYGRLSLKRGLDFIDTTGEVAIEMDGVGIGFDVSALWRVSPHFNLGLSYKSRGKIGVTGGANFETPDAFVDKARDQAVESQIRLPDRIALGSALRRGLWTFVGDVELSTWSVRDAQVIDFERDETPDVVQRANWSNTFALRFGAERPIGSRFTIRTGAYFDPSPAPSDSLSPTSPDCSRVGVTVGGAYAISNRLKLDIYVEHMQLLEHKAADPESLSATYRGRAELFGASLSYAFTDSVQPVSQPVLATK